MYIYISTYFDSWENMETRGGRLLLGWPDEKTIKPSVGGETLADVKLRAIFQRAQKVGCRKVGYRK